MFKKNCFIEVGDNYLIRHEHNPRILSRAYRKNEYNINLLKEAQFSLKSRKAYVVLEGEKINIKMMTFPKVKNKELYKLIIEELTNYYNSVDKIYFNFTVIKDNGKSLDIIVFYSNEGKIKKLEKYILGNSHIRGVYLIQFCFLQNFRATIMHEDFIFAFMYKAKLYFLFCINKKIVYNNMVTYTEEVAKISNSIFEFMESCRINNGCEIKNIYIANIDERVCTDITLKGYYVENLGSMDEKSLIKCIKKSRR